MARRTVTLTPFLERCVRKLQVSIIEKQERDVSFTEALNLLLAAGLQEMIQNSTVSSDDKTQWTKVLLDGMESLGKEAVTDQTLSDLVKTLVK